MPTLSAADFEVLSRTLLTAAGASEDDTTVITDSLLWATLRGNDSHGVAHLPMYVRMFARPDQPPGLNRDGAAIVTSESDAVVAVDGNGCAGQTVLLRTAEMVAAKAATVGVAVGSTKRTSHHGALGFALEPLLARDMIGLILACSGAASPPYGGCDRKLGTNPMAVGIPAGAHPPILIDMATSATTWLGLLAMWKSGEPLPAGLILDDDGNPTTDRSGFVFGFRTQDGEGRGALSPIGGGHKGYALQLAVEMLGGILPGLASGNDVGLGGQVTALVIAIRVGAFQDVVAFKERVDQRIEELKASRPVSGGSEIWIPGERGFRLRAQRLAEGIPVTDDDWIRIEKVAGEVGVDLAAFGAVAS